MLIINADDFGRDLKATDRALACYRANRISSTTGMVFMADSQRAAALAAESGIPTGLHINFSEAFTDPSAPDALRRTHRRISRFLRSNKHALLLFHPFLSREFKSCFNAQLAEFRRLYGKEPTHLDGHQHLHLATNVLLSRVLPAGTKVRRSFTFSAGEKDPINRGYRRLVDRSLARRHTITDHFFSIAHYLDPVRLERVIELSTRHQVELMTHPALDNEFSFLSSDSFAAAVGRTSLGSYEDLVA